MAEIKNPYDIPEKIEARKDQEDPWVLYLIVRESLEMSAGKIGAQCGHAVGMIDRKFRELDKIFDYGDVLDIFDENEQLLYDNFISWEKDSYRKVVLRADDKEWEKLKKELPCFIVRDAGLTEVVAGSETVIGLWPMKKSKAPKIVKKLQVLK